MTGDGSPPLSVVVVTRDEEERVGACLESVFETCRAADAVDAFEVVLVDSNSRDRTVERAREFPVTVLEIPDDDLTTPGAGRYVGTRHVDGEAILFVDGDMVLEAEWLPEALAHLEREGVAAVDGHLNDVPADAEVRTVDSVRGVALYDTDALESVGGFDPFLESVEDIHLGFELTAAGYRLVRLPRVAATHPAGGTLSEPFRRWRRGYTRGTGQAIRRSLASPRLLWKHLYRIRHRLALAAWAALGVASLATGAGVLAWLALSVVGVGVVAAARGGVTEGVAWVGYKASLLVGLVVGLLDEPTPPERFPTERVAVLAEAPVHDGSTSGVGPAADAGSTADADPDVDGESAADTGSATDAGSAADTRS